MLYSPRRVTLILALDDVDTMIYFEELEETMTPSAAVGRVQVVKWGNSQAVRLPKAVLEQAHVQEGDELTVRVEGGRIA